MQSKLTYSRTVTVGLLKEQSNLIDPVNPKRAPAFDNQHETFFKTQKMYR